MSWTQGQLDALEVAISKGTKTVAYGDKSVTYHSLKEMMELRAQMASEITVVATGSGTFSRVSFSRD